MKLRFIYYFSLSKTRGSLSVCMGFGIFSITQSRCHQKSHLLPHKRPLNNHFRNSTRSMKLLLAIEQTSVLYRCLS